MAPHGKELSEDLKKRIVALHKDGLGCKKIAKTLKLSGSTMAKTIQRFNRTGSTQNRPRHGRPKKLSAHAQRHIQRLALGNRRMSAASIAAEVEGVGAASERSPDFRSALCFFRVTVSVFPVKPRVGGACCAPFPLSWRRHLLLLLVLRGGKGQRGEGTSPPPHCRYPPAAREQGSRKCHTNLCECGVSGTKKN
ncbi:Paired box protein Pax-1 [Varanus komodoensis]|nr:Paired box protein Pax-1 [Varanus komodoensis]